MRPPSRRLAPQGQNHQAAPRGRRGAASGEQGTPPPSPPQFIGGRGPAGETAAPHPPRGAVAPGGGTPQQRQARPCARRPRWTARTLPHYPLPTGDRMEAPKKGANEAAHSEAGLGQAAERTGARRSPPPPRHSDPLAADRAAPGAHGRLTTPTARVYPRGARRRRRVTGTGARSHPTGQGGGEQRRGPFSPPSPPRSPPGRRAAGAPALCPPRG